MFKSVCGGSYCHRRNISGGAHLCGGRHIGTLGGSISASNVPVDADGVAFWGDKTRFSATLCPDYFTISKLDKGGGFLVEKEVVPCCAQMRQTVVEEGLPLPDKKG